VHLSGAAARKRLVEYAISNELDSQVCVIVLTGNVGAERAITLLDSVWQNAIYAKSRYVIWDLENCGTFPDFNEFVLIANYARKHKPKNGPARIAFCSATFENSMLINILKGFTRALPSNFRYLATQGEALGWFATSESDVA